MRASIFTGSDGFCLLSNIFRICAKDFFLHLLAKKPKSPRGIVRILTDRDDQPAIEVRYNARTSARPSPRRMVPSASPPRPGQPGKLKPSIRPRDLRARPRTIPGKDAQPLRIKERSTVHPIKKLPAKPKK